MKKIINFIKSRRIEVPVFPSAVLLFIFCIIVSAVVFYIDPGSFKRSISLCIEQPLLFFLNTLPILIFAYVLFMISNNGAFAAFSTAMFFIVAAVANREKIVIRSDPFIPSDVVIFKEAFGIIKNFPPLQLAAYISILAAFSVLIIFSLLFFRTKRIKPVIRIIVIAALIIAGFGANNSLYSSDSLYSKFTVDGNIYFDVNQFSSKGFVYSFLYKFNTMKIEKPEDYNAQKFADIEEDYLPESIEKNKLPNIIMIMGESFSDLSENSHFDFSSYGDPMENIKRIAQSENSIYGHITVPNYGGGTSNTEFDVLTGYSTRYLVNDGTSYNYIRSTIDSIPQRLKSIGYNTLAIHPGFSWFYNRINVYSYMGFENFIHLTSFQGEEKYKGGYIADRYLSDSIIENYEKHVEESDDPYFNFCVTIENHGPYDEKYNTVDNMFDCDIDLTPSEKNLLDSYFMGIKDNDIEIGRLTDYFAQKDEPVIFVFFGDHMPGFSNGMGFFELLDYDISPNGTVEQQLNVYSTPFLIWENDAAAELTNFKEKKQTVNLPENNRISAFYLGTTVLELSGINHISPFLDYNTELKASLPVIRDDNYMLKDESFTTELPSELKESLDLFKQWEYYKMFDEK